MEMLRTMEELEVKMSTLVKEIYNDDVYVQVMNKQLRILREKEKHLRKRIQMRQIAQTAFEKTLEEGKDAVEKVQAQSAHMTSVMRAG